MDNFTPLASTAGGALIGLSAALVMVLLGRVAGISGIVGALLSRPPGDTLWRVTYVLGLIVGGLAIHAVDPSLTAMTLDRSTGAIAAAGVLVGFGTRLGNGCTSGHGVCGLSRVSPRSGVATLTFMVFGALTAVLVGQLLGGSI